MKRVFHRLLCWMLVLAIAGLPALAAAVGVGVEDGHAGHAMHGAQFKGDAEHGAHDHGHDAAHHHHVHGDRADPADSSQGPDPVPSGHSQASELLVHADCVDAACLAACAACSHCQGMPSITGMSVVATEAPGANLHSFQSGPSTAALHRPPILS